MRDEQTEAYFDRRRAEYPVHRFEFAAAALREQGRAGGTLLDVGCGTGNTLEYLRDTAGIRQLAGIDVSRRCVARTRSRLGCRAWQGSILDRALAERFDGEFDVVVVAAVLHHLVGPTRTRSRELARTALIHCLRMVRPGGLLVVIEPVFEPRWVMDAVFHVKRMIGTVARGRVELLSQANNLGPPVVSFYSEGELRELLRRAGAGEIVGRNAVGQRPGRLFRAAGIRRRDDLTLLVQRQTNGA